MLARALGVLCAAGLVLTACAATPDADESPAALTSGDTVRLLTYDSYAISEKTLADFTKETGQEVEIVKAGDAGAMVNRALLSVDNPEGDVLFGIDNNLSSRGIDGDLFVEYQAAGIEEVPADLREATDDRLTPIDTGDVCINTDTAYFDKNDLAPPQTLQDLTKSEYRDLLVVQNPGSSTPGLAFLLATVAEFGPDGFASYWESLRDNGVRVEESWSSAYEQQFSGSSGGGNRPIVVSYASSPAAEVIFAAEAPKSAPTAASLDTCYRQIEYAGVLANSPNETGARQFVDFMLTNTYQEDIPGNNFVYPVLPGATLPPEFDEYAPQPSDPMSLPAPEVALNRETWVSEWSSVMQG
ncbi:MAG: thiamine ABC transporter substrate-binding protein [Actinomycetia bacterium]|nr:thiamine ABC transporter substrate-binding protein [Actinomycetes bacterium]